MAFDLFVSNGDKDWLFGYHPTGNHQIWRAWAFFCTIPNALHEKSWQQELTAVRFFSFMWKENNDTDILEYRCIEIVTCTGACHLVVFSFMHEITITIDGIWFVCLKWWQRLTVWVYWRRLTEWVYWQRLTDWVSLKTDWMCWQKLTACTDENWLTESTDNFWLTECTENHWLSEWTDSI